jgi:hypothetical protein
MALGCEVTSVRGNRGENDANEPVVRKKHIKNNKIKHIEKRIMYLYWFFI